MRALRRTAAALLVLGLGSALAVGVSGCSTLGLAALEKPEVRLMGIDVGDVGLDSAELLFDFDVDNPNARDLILDGVAYRLNVEGARLLDGRRGQRTEIIALGKSRVTLPVTVRYDDLARAVRNLRRQEHPTYELRADFEFDAPVVGTLVVPVTQRGRVPLDRLAGWLGRILG
jgi:LEA14-like dessication related protein